MPHKIVCWRPMYDPAGHDLLRNSGAIVDVIDSSDVQAVAAAIADADANINSVEMKERDDRHTTLRFIIEVKNRGHLAKVIRKIRLIKNVSHIDRK